VVAAAGGGSGRSGRKMAAGGSVKGYHTAAAAAVSHMGARAAVGSTKQFMRVAPRVARAVGSRGVGRGLHSSTCQPLPGPVSA
jgi:hypothetical protein